METFLSCDWGTSNFRLRLIRTNDLQVLATVRNDQGISQIARAWQQQRDIDRQTFYTSFLNDCIAEMEQQQGRSLNGTTVVLSGMASSSIGLVELPYSKLPFRTNGEDLITEQIQHQNNPLLVISGASTTDDVMRGEETKIVGAAASLSETAEEQIMILPGTHSKHVSIRNGQVISFQTFMTGEFFALLSGSSILAASVATGGELNEAANRESFINAVKQSREIPLLQHSFKVRTNQLLKGISKEQNYYYLSGLLIGEELKNIPSGQPVTLMGGSLHTQLYMLACDTLGITITATPDADEALIKGQKIILLSR